MRWAWQTALSAHLLGLVACGEEAVQAPREPQEEWSAGVASASETKPPVASEKSAANNKDVELNPHAIARRAAPAVVMVACKPTETTIRRGSGFHIGQGYVVTNLHVVAGCSNIGVKPHGGEFLAVQSIAAYSVDDDIAILRVGDFPTVARLDLARGTEAEPGDSVVVLGNPLGLELSVSNGIVAARREMAGKPYVQITAPISPGSSGGPVLNNHGKVIGIATLTLVGGQALNFAVDSKTLRALVPTAESQEIPLAAFGVATAQHAEPAPEETAPPEPRPSPANDLVNDFPSAVAGFGFGMTLAQAQLKCTDDSNQDASRRGLRWFTALQQEPKTSNFYICPRAPEPLDFVKGSVFVLFQFGKLVRIGFVATNRTEAMRRLTLKYGEPPLQEINGKNQAVTPGRVPKNGTMVWPLKGGFLRLIENDNLVLYISAAEKDLSKEGY